MRHAGAHVQHGDDFQALQRTVAALVLRVEALEAGNDLEESLMVCWTLMALALLADEADEQNVRVALAQQMGIDFRDLPDPPRDAPLLARAIGAS